MTKLLVIDNYDSFTYNLVAYCQELGVDTLVYYNDEITCSEIEKINPDKILLSPGPGNTKDSGVTMQVIDNFHQTIPILGVCLGHQCLAEYFGAKVTHAPRIMHGKTSKIKHDNSLLFKNIENEFTACRYHSLIVDYDSIKYNPDLIITAHTLYNTEFEIMALAHKAYSVYGVQFHPEAVLTEYGHRLLENFLNVVPQ